jgi:hypothetical protein
VLISTGRYVRLRCIRGNLAILHARGGCGANEHRQHAPAGAAKSPAQMRRTQPSSQGYRFRHAWPPSSRRGKTVIGPAKRTCWHLVESADRVRATARTKWRPLTAWIQVGVEIVPIRRITRRPAIINPPLFLASGNLLQVHNTGIARRRLADHRRLAARQTRRGECQG